mmetsp:Transcript_6954/g.10201  ORF Transcript_6954/g.10201 Transcript_6954/m.10201 type:complete len:266 (+) Transcript_6954:49-846(+)
MERSMQSMLAMLLLLLVIAPRIDAFSITRRDALLAGSIAAGSALMKPTEEAWAKTDIKEDALTGPPERQDLLRAIKSRASDDEVAAKIAALENLNPSNGNGATSSALGGKWELIYSVNAEAFSPLLNLPAPIRPTSLQLLGEEAASEVGAGRVAQVLNFPIVPLSLVLSSGAVPVPTDSTTLEIFPPFRLEAKAGKSLRYQIVESGSDADFRALNARDEDAQAAGRNMYKQRYLETTGKAGDLRISEVVSGDPVIVGEVFIHKRL